MWIFERFFKEDKPNIWRLATLNGPLLNENGDPLEGSWGDLKRRYRNNISNLYIKNKLKYIFKESLDKKLVYKIDLGAKYREIMHDDNHF